MKKFIVFILAMIFLLVGNETFANSKKKPNKYLGLQFGIANACDVQYNTPDLTPSSYDISAKSGGGGGIVFGVLLDNSNLRLELELSGQSHDLETIKASIGSSPVTGKLGLFNMMGNLYYDFQNDTIITPFLFAGLGLSIGTLEKFPLAREVQQLSKDPSWLALAFQTGVGLTISFTDHVLLDLSGQYFNSSEGEQKVRIIGSLSEYAIKINRGGNTSFHTGLRFIF